jgi:hypothetical protein
MNSMLAELNGQLSAGAPPSARSSHDLDSDDACTSTAAISADPSLSFDISKEHASVETWDVGEGWFHVHVPKNLKASANVTVNAGLTISTTGAASCALSLPLASLQGDPIPVDVGVPVVLTPSAGLSVSGSVTASGAITVSASASVTDAMKGKLIPPTFNNAISSAYTLPTMNANATLSASATITATVSVDVDGIANASVTAGPQLNLSTTATTTPATTTPGTTSWSLQACLSAGFSLQASIFTLGHNWNLFCSALDQGGSSGSTGTTTTTTTTSPVAANGVPLITSVSAITNDGTQTIIISGSGFGSAAPYVDQDSSSLEIADETTAWQACYSGLGNVVTCSIMSWTNTTIVLSGFGSYYGYVNWTYQPGNSLTVSVWNAQSGSGPGEYQLTAT